MGEAGPEGEDVNERLWNDEDREEGQDKVGWLGIVQGWVPGSAWLASQAVRACLREHAATAGLGTRLRRKACTCPAASRALPASACHPSLLPLTSPSPPCIGRYPPFPHAAAPGGPRGRQGGASGGQEPAGLRRRWVGGRAGAAPLPHHYVGTIWTRSLAFVSFVFCAQVPTLHPAHRAAGGEDEQEEEGGVQQEPGDAQQQQPEDQAAPQPGAEEEEQEEEQLGEYEDR